jgi:hypothetical protein
MSPHHRPSKSPKLEFKMDAKNHEKKRHFNLATGQFLFSKYKTNQRITYFE